jgi:hypothetical protein
MTNVTFFSRNASFGLFKTINITVVTNLTLKLFDVSNETSALELSKNWSNTD